jgi:8-oxo-dGTP pyrophosphatase MutT (NUDIX family)
LPILLNNTLQTLCQTYYSQNPDEISRGQALLDFLANEKDYFSRTNFHGHFTVSGFVLSPDRKSILLIHHRQLQRYLQPGGHFENDISLLAGALREIEEEVGIKAEQLINLCDVEIPFDVDPHTIPANAKKGEPSHTHFDCRFLFAVSGDVEVTLAKNEVTGYKWVALTDPLLPIYLGEWVVKKICKTINRSDFT